MIRWIISINAGFYILCYFIYSFNTWTLLNPFEWVYSLPSYSMETRATVLAYFSIWTVISVAVAIHKFKTKSNENEANQKNS
jgi:hypothetical protein